jgi:hypothetical protein
VLTEYSWIFPDPHLALRVLQVTSPDAHGTPHFEPSKNYWENSGLKADSALTDVAWAHGSAPEYV